MFTNDDILMPLAIAVVIDRHVREPELSEFAKQGQALQRLFDLDVMTEDELIEWFVVNIEDLKEKLDSKRRNTLVLRVLSKFTEGVHMDNLYDAIVQISVSDKEYRREESEFVKSAATLWGYDRPPIKICLLYTSDAADE